MSEAATAPFSDLQAGSYQCRDGTTLFYGRSQTENKPPIILLHSLAMDHGFWKPVIKSIARKADVVALDCRGHGESEKPDGPYSLELFSQDVADLMDHLGWSEAIVAGASMGGAVALQFAIAHPDRTSGLGLIDTTSWYGPTAISDWQKRAEKARTEGFSSMTDFQVTRWFSETFRENNQELVQECKDVFCSNDVEAYVETCLMMGAFDLRSGLGTLNMPCAILVGEEDYATPPEMAQALHQGIPKSTIKVIKGGRHLTPLECPELVANSILSMTERVE